MYFKDNTKLLLCTALLLFATKVSQAQQLTCYICNDCAKITNETPLEVCDEDFFNNGGTTLPSTMTTADLSSTTETTEEITTTDAITTETTTSTVAASTTTASTETPFPMPSTPGIPQTTTDIPTPPNPGTVIIPADIVENKTATNPSRTATTKLTLLHAASTESTSAPSSTAVSSNPSESNITLSLPAVRQARSLMNSGITYHCYSINKKENSTIIVERGCIRVTTEQAVCTILEAMNQNVTLSKCFPCSQSKCNSSSTLTVSIIALLLSLIAAMLMRNN